MSARARRVRVVVLLDAAALEDLQAIVEHRRGADAASRSAVVREAVMWLRAREAAWLLRDRAYREKTAREHAEMAAALTRADRERQAVADTVAAALRIARDDRS